MDDDVDGKRSRLPRLRHGSLAAGHRRVQAASEIIDGDTIDLLVASHSDSDHLADDDDVLNEFKVQQLIRLPLTADEIWVAGTSAEVQSLDLSDLEPGTYFWRVSALDADGYESAWSHTAHFIYPMSLR